MNILDNVGINYIFDNNLSIQGEYLLVPDVVDEAELAEIKHSKKILNEVTRLSNSPYFDKSIYLDFYKKILNKYDGGRSFYNMTGFGDVSILASIHMLLVVFDIQKQSQLFDTSRSIIVFTEDRSLIKKIESEFIGKNVTIKSLTDIQ